MQYPSDTNPKPTITLPARQPRSEDELPHNIGGVRVVVRPKKEQKVEAFYQSELGRLTHEEYTKDSKVIEFARAHNLVIDDVTPPEVLEARDKASRKSADAMLAAIRKRDTRKAASDAYKAYETARLEFGHQSKLDPTSTASYAAERKMSELGQAWEKLEQEAKTAQAE